MLQAYSFCSPQQARSAAKFHGASIECVVRFPNVEAKSMNTLDFGLILTRKVRIDPTRLKCIYFTIGNGARIHRVSVKQ